MELQQEIVTELRSLAAWFREISRITHMSCTGELNLKRADKWDTLAARVENARCDTCLEYDRFNNYCECKSWHMACGDICWDYQVMVRK